MATNTETQVQQLYVGLLGRAADKAGLTYWANQITTGARTLDDVRAAFVTTTEYTTGFGALTARADLVTAIYTNLFERTPTAAEVAYWVADTRPANQLVSAFLTYASAADQAVITNKTFVAQTYTDTVDASNFSIAGATASIATVDGTSASVTAALTAITAGTLPGQVAGLGLISAQSTAVAAELAYETSNKAAIDALATKLGVTVVADFDAELASINTAANTAVTNATGGKTITVLTAEATDATAAQTAARAALDTAGKTKADAYVAAVKANAALKAAAPADVAAAKAGLAADTGYADALAKVTAVKSTVTDIDTLYAYYTAATTTAAQRTAVDTDFAAVTKFATFKTTAATDITKNVAIQTQTSTEAAADSAFVTASKAATAANDTVTTAKAAIADQDAVKAIVTAHDAVQKAVTDAGTAISDFNGSSATTELKVLANATATVVADAAVKETFYFSAKPDSSDFAIGSSASTQFAAGDSIVLGNGYTFNSGALTTGNSSALEFFLVKGTTSTQIVIETAAYGNASATLNADGTVNASPDATVITLTGVTADHLAVNNGVISYV